MPIASERKSKEDVNYRLHEQCSSCVHFYGGICEIVEGRISPDAVCTEWKLKEMPKHHDGEFFVGQYKEENKEKNAQTPNP